MNDIKVSNQINVRIIDFVGVYIMDTFQKKEIAILPFELVGLRDAIDRAIQNFSNQGVIKDEN